MNRETIGKISSDLLAGSSEKVSVIDQMREQLSDYERNIEECIAAHKNKWHQNFFVVVITKQEPLMPNVMRNYFLARLSCPTPDYDQILYQYDYKKDFLSFVWVIPSRDSCFYLKNNSVAVADEERHLLNFVLAFENGTLYRWCKKFNKEDAQSNEIKE